MWLIIDSRTEKQTKDDAKYSGEGFLALVVVEDISTIGQTWLNA